MSLSIRSETDIACKYCGSSFVDKCGSYNGVQRYWCKSCRHKFKLDTNLFHMQVPAQYVYSALSSYYQGVGVGEIRRSLKNNYDYYPTRSLIHYWIHKYTVKAFGMFESYKPEVGDVWIGSEIGLRLNGRNIWIYEAMDRDTQFILATVINNSSKLFVEAARKAGKNPRLVLLVTRNPNLSEMAFGCSVENIHVRPEAGKEYPDLSPPLRGVTDLVKVLHRLRGLAEIQHFLKGWYVSFNFFRPNQTLDGRTPAESAGINYYIKSWADAISRY